MSNYTNVSAISKHANGNVATVPKMESQVEITNQAKYSREFLCWPFINMYNSFAKSRWRKQFKFKFKCNWIIYEVLMRAFLRFIHFLIRYFRVEIENCCWCSCEIQGFRIEPIQLAAEPLCTKIKCIFSVEKCLKLPFLWDLNHFTTLCSNKIQPEMFFTTQKHRKHHINGVNISICFTVETPKKRWFVFLIPRWNHWNITDIMFIDYYLLK